MLVFPGGEEGDCTWVGGGEKGGVGFRNEEFMVGIGQLAVVDPVPKDIVKGPGEVCEEAFSKGADEGVAVGG